MIVINDYLMYNDIIVRSPEFSGQKTFFQRELHERAEVFKNICNDFPDIPKPIDGPLHRSLRLHRQRSSQYTIDPSVVGEVLHTFATTSEMTVSDANKLLRKRILDIDSESEVNKTIQEPISLKKWRNSVHHLLRATR